MCVHVDSLQPYADDIIATVDVDTIVSRMMTYGLLTLGQYQQLTSGYTTNANKLHTLCGIVLALSEDHVDKFLQCLSDTSYYRPHNSLLNKIKNVSVPLAVILWLSVDLYRWSDENHKSLMMKCVMTPPIDDPYILYNETFLICCSVD